MKQIDDLGLSILTEEQLKRIFDAGEIQEGQVFGTTDGGKFMHNIRADATTSVGTWHYQFELENNVATPYTQIGQVGHYLFGLNNGVRIPCTGMCTINNDKYLIAAIKSTQDNMITFEMYNLSDGTFKDDMTSGAIDIVDVVS